MSVTHRQSDKRDSTVIADVSLRCAVKKIYIKAVT